MSVPVPFVYNAEVISVHDGDTFSVAVDFGFYSYLGSAEHPVPVRLLNCNARELNEPGGKEAQTNLATLLPVGSPVVLKTAKPDKYAPRWDAEVETPDHPDLVKHLIDEQWVAEWDGKGTRPVPPWPRETS